MKEEHMSFEDWKSVFKELVEIIRRNSKDDKLAQAFRVIFDRVEYDWKAEHDLLMELTECCSDMGRSTFWNAEDI